MNNHEGVKMKLVQSHNDIVTFIRLRLKQSTHIPFSILLLGCGPLNARNLSGINQFKSPFSTRCCKSKITNIINKNGIME